MEEVDAKYEIDPVTRQENANTWIIAEAASNGHLAVVNI